MSYHRYPICPSTGKIRYGELKDIKLTMRQVAKSRSSARLDKVACSRREVRSYECSDCRGWHLTSQPARLIRLVSARKITVHVPGPAALAIRRMAAGNGLIAGAVA